MQTNICDISSLHTPTTPLSLAVPKAEVGFTKTAKIKSSFFLQTTTGTTIFILLYVLALDI